MFKYWAINLRPILFYCILILRPFVVIKTNRQP